MKRTNLAKQKGFSLIELLVALALLTLLAVAIAGAFDGSRSRAQALLSMMSELGSAQARHKNDTGCYTNKPLALFDPATGQAAANNVCARAQTNTWNGPYLTRFTADGSGSVVADKVAEGVLVSFGVESAGVGKRYFVHTINLPDDVARQTLQECNNAVILATMQLTTAFDKFKCRSTGIGSGNLATIDMLYDETR
jgi:prepilin-type N-terminal cleavage/methylation domain-containing protein